MFSKKVYQLFCTSRNMKFTLDSLYTPRTIEKINIVVMFMYILYREIMESNLLPSIYDHHEIRKSNLLPRIFYLFNFVSQCNHTLNSSTGNVRSKTNMERQVLGNASAVPLLSRKRLPYKLLKQYFKIENRFFFQTYTLIIIPGCMAR